ncbi:hypothetical protein FSP39_015632 [Pinctada imbricata]|uniref:Short-chain collagen C4 n=1 Tax=Pinctada imbricata TaxID=66713 RepID=A0AA88XNP3_PINIB|nr:hypothetical protein FSP39_015632 [Pinctada imbricata]
MNSAIYGAKYDSDADFFGTKNGDGLPCAVCRSSSDVTSVMIPARRTCYKSWRKQYNGYLATNRDGSYGSKDYICINEDPDSFATAEDHGLRAIFQSTVASCGSLACPPYINYRRLTCVVYITATMAVQMQIVLLVLTFNSANGIEKKLLLNDPNQMEREIQELRTLVTTLTSQVSAIQQSKGGAQFIRWGKSVCPDNDTELVYDGFAAGGYYSNKGAGVNYLCLPRDPLWGINYTGTIYSTIYGAEYDTSFFGTNNGDDLPCAVCRSRSGVTSMMLPGRNKCYKHWRMQYNGYLATSGDSFDSSKEYICINENADAMVGGGHDYNGALFYSVAASCTSLACPPYISGKRLTCAVCTK